jgi:5-methylcytosine-specific restriction endonuclease McrA
MADEDRRSAKAIHIDNGGSGLKDWQKRLILFRRQGARCAICGTPMKLRGGDSEDMAATLDHIIPKSRRGGNGLTNLRATHRKCNRERGNSLDDVFVDAAGLVALRWNIKGLP